MRDLRDGDVIVRNEYGYSIQSDNLVEPLVFKDLKSYAQWWIRQSELRLDITIPSDVKLVFSELLKDPLTP